MARIVRNREAARVVPRALASAVAEAERRLAEADARAEALLDRARREADDRLLSAQREAEAEAAARRAALTLELAERRHLALRSAEPELLALAGEIARRAVEEAFDLDPSRLAVHVAHALAHARRARSARVRIAAGSTALLREVLPRSVQLVEDPSLGPGDCVVESDVGTIDARIDVRIERLVAALGGASP